MQKELSYDEYQAAIERNNTPITLLIQTTKHEKEECYSLEVKRAEVETILQMVEAGKLIAVPTATHLIYVNPIEIVSIVLPLPEDLKKIEE